MQTSVPGNAIYPEMQSLKSDKSDVFYKVSNVVFFKISI